MQPSESQVLLLVDTDVSTFQSPLAALSYFEPDYDSDEAHSFVDCQGTTRSFRDGALQELGLTPEMGRRLGLSEHATSIGIESQDLTALMHRFVSEHQALESSNSVRVELSVTGAAGRFALTVIGKTSRGCSLLFASANDVWAEVAHVRSGWFPSRRSVLLDPGQYLVTCLVGGRDGVFGLVVDGSVSRVVQDVEVRRPG